MNGMRKKSNTREVVFGMLILFEDVLKKKVLADTSSPTRIGDIHGSKGIRLYAVILFFCRWGSQCSIPYHRR